METPDGEVCVTVMVDGDGMDVCGVVWCGGADGEGVSVCEGNLARCGFALKKLDLKVDRPQ